MPTSVLFVCIHNSARSQMAEAFLALHGAGRFASASAGLEPGRLNPVVVAAMRERGIDIAGKATTGVQELIAAGRRYDYVITVCDEASAERCPVFPGPAKRLHWGFPDPSAFTGTPEDKLQRTREIRDVIEGRVRAWCAEFAGG